MSWTWNSQEISLFLYIEENAVKTSLSRVSRVSRTSLFSTSSTAHTSCLYSRTRVMSVLYETYTDLYLTLVFSSKASVLRAYTSSLSCMII